ncbi:glycogen synthase [Bacteroidia bacterium]|nr:glycogen synthase [Bacteroidia bacterium]
MLKPKILYVSQEIFPYAEETEISQISRFLPERMKAVGYEVRLFMPCYGTINTRRFQLHEVIRLVGTNFTIGESFLPIVIRVASIPSAKMQIYFIDNEECFKRKFQMQDEHDALFADNHKRMIVFARGTLKAIKDLIWQPALIHCHGWFSALTPLYIKKAFCHDPFFAATKIVVSIYDENFSEELSADAAKHAIITGIKAKDTELLKHSSYVNLMKFAIANADGVIVGSKKIHPDLVKHLKTLKIPVLPYQNEEQRVKAYSTFYNKILNN